MGGLGEEDPLAEALKGAENGPGRWQLQRVVLALLVGLPGLCHIFLSIFGFARGDFTCTEGGGVNQCVVNCSRYEFDRSFWRDSVSMQFQLVCQGAQLGALFKLSFFSGFAAGTLLAGIVSDALGRTASITLFSQVICEPLLDTSINLFPL